MRPLLAGIALLAAATLAVAAYTIPPNPPQAVSDYAGVLRPEDTRALEDLAREVWDKSKVAMVVVTIRSLEGEVLEELTLRWGRAWGIGERETNRGILLLLAVEDRKIRVENGYGVEGFLPDGLTGAILDDEALPSFRRGDYSGGIRKTMERIASLVAAENNVEIKGAAARRAASRPTRGRLSARELFFVFLIAGIIGVLAVRALMTSQGHPAGRFRRRRRRDPWWWGGLGGGFGGFGGGGGLGGGGFGGFGGGSFGGGGASRGW